MQYNVIYSNYHQLAVIATVEEDEVDEEKHCSLCNIVKNKVMSKGLPMKSSTPAAKAACIVS